LNDLSDNFFSCVSVASIDENLRKHSFASKALLNRRGLVLNYL
jgi:hypothetical protein